MDVVSLHSAIIKNELDNFFIFTGVESKVQRVYIDKISEVVNKPLRFIDNVSEIYGKSGNSLFSKSYCYVCMDDTDFMKSEHAWETVKDAIGDNVLILWISNIDKRGKFYKHYKDDIYDFDTLNEEILKKHIREHLHLSETNINSFIDICGRDYGRCLLEADKVRHYIKAYGADKQEEMTDDGGYLRLRNEGVLHADVGDIIFEFTDAVLYGDVAGSFNLYDKCVSIGESQLKMLTILYNKFKAMLQVQSCKSDDIESATGLSSWEIKYTKKLIGAYSIGELVSAIRLLRQIEVDFKQGRIEESMIVPYALVNIL